MVMEQRENKIVIIIPYFGKWPPWMEYFLLSCGYNSSIDWLLFSDCGKPSSKADNVRYIDFTLDDLNRLASQRTGLSLDIRDPYKLCDLKPAYGDVFADYIGEYEFWGYGDIDLIYGNLNAYFIDELLENYDILSNHYGFITGHLCLLRNIPETVFLYKKDDLYKAAFKDPYYTGFDEQLLKRKINPEAAQIPSRMRSHLRQHMMKVSMVSFLSGMVPAGLKARLRGKVRSAVRDFSSIVRHYAQHEGIRVLQVRTFQSDLMLKKLGVENWTISWDKGQLRSSYNREGILYFHFILSKLNKSFSIQEFVPGTDRFMLTVSGITRSIE